MTEQEARKLFRSLAKPSEDSPVPTICMYESEAIEFAKAYAAAQVAAKDAEIEAMALTYINDIGDCHAAMLKDRERITELKDELLRLINEQETNCEEYVKTLTEDANYGLNQEIAELTRKLQIQDTMHANAEAVLKEEIKRLREGVRKALKYIEGPHHSNPEPIAIYEILQHILSPSDVDGETKADHVVDEFIKGLDYCECNGCGWVGQVGETIEIDYFDSCPKCKEQSMYLLEDDQAEDHWNEYRALKPMTGRGIKG